MMHKMQNQSDNKNSPVQQKKQPKPRGQAKMAVTSKAMPKSEKHPATLDVVYDTCDLNVNTENVDVHDEHAEPRGKRLSPHPQAAEWESFISDAVLSDEQRKLMMKLRKKLREIDQINLRIEAGETVETNQHAKVALRPQLMNELADCLNNEAMLDDSGFVEVVPGVSHGKLRTEALQHISNYEAEALRIDSESDTVVEPVAPSKKQLRKKRLKEAKNLVNKREDSSWTLVDNSRKKKVLTEEEKHERRLIEQSRQAEKVKSMTTPEYERTRASLRTFKLLNPETTSKVEMLIEKVVDDAAKGLLKWRSVDLTPMRNKYFFGFAYTYGAQKEHPGAHGIEAVWDPAETEPIPAWIHELMIKPLEQKGVVPKDWINSATINDYSPGGCIVSHIDPPHLFDRPIISSSFFSDCNLVFGTTFSFPKDAANIECSTPVYVQLCERGASTVLKGYSANDITHAIRPCDLPSRRASIILRRVLPTAPVLLESAGVTVPLKDLEKYKSIEMDKIWENRQKQKPKNSVSAATRMKAGFM